MLIFLLCLAVQSFDPIRIKLYTQYLESDNRKMYKHFLLSASQYIEETYNVKRSDHIILKEQICHHITVPKKHRNKVIKNKDFILYVAETYEDDTWIAKSAPCAYNELHRPIAGGIVLNNKYFNKLKKWERYERFGTIVHELTHTLGFHREVMTRSNMTQMINNKLYIKTSGIITYAREYFNCSTLEYLPLEDDGGKTAMYSHFEKMTFNQELMTGTASRDTINSRFTLLALQDTGLYTVNLEKAGRFEWGKGKGCAATQGTCDSPTICTQNKKERFCSYNYQHISFCKPNQKLAECGLPTALKDCQKKKCFNIGETSAKCLKSKCTSQGILVKYKKQKQFCQSDKQEIVLLDLKIKCPIYRDFCNKYSLCNNRGEYKNGKCHCSLGFRGRRCQKII